MGCGVSNSMWYSNLYKNGEKMQKTCTRSKKKLKMYHFRPLFDEMKKIVSFGHFLGKFALFYTVFLHVFISDGLTIT